MELVVLGLNHKTAPVEIRERLAFTRFSSESYLQKLAEQHSIRAGLVLSTCNRVEVYASGEEADQLLKDAVEFVRLFHNVREDEVHQFFYNKVNREAVRHLFRVASSLDSMIVGEPQILGQVKEAYFASSSCSMTDPFFDLLLQKTFSVAKRVRTETSVAQQAVSVSFAAVELAEKIFGDLHEKSVLILGAGEMAEQAARHLKRKEVRELIFTNRSYEHSVELAQEYGGLPVAFAQYEKYMSKADIVVVSTAAPHYLIRRPQVEQWMAERRNAPIFLIDISVPRNVEPDVHRIENVYLYNIDDLQSVVVKNLQAREQEAHRAEEIVEMEVEQFFRHAGKLELSPIILELQKKYDPLMKAELDRLCGRLSSVTESEQAEIQRTLETLVRKMLNDPILFLKGDLEPQLMKERAQLLRQVFSLTREKKEDE